MGPSGCGKGTQARNIDTWLRSNDERHVIRMETGKRLRSFIDHESDTAKRALEINELGSLQPEFLAVWTWSDELVSKYRENSHIIIDGSPRRKHEAAVLHSAMEFYDRYKPVVIFLNISDSKAKERLLLRDRSDDNIDDIEKRLSWFKTAVLPTLEYYKHHPDYRFVEIDAELTEAEVSRDIAEKLLSLDL